LRKSKAKDITNDTIPTTMQQLTTLHYLLNIYIDPFSNPQARFRTLKDPNLQRLQSWETPNHPTKKFWPLMSRWQLAQ